MPGRERRRVGTPFARGSASGMPSTRSISARGRPPGRSSVGRRDRRRWSNSSRHWVGPPSRMRSMRPPRSASTCAAVVGETWPDRLADGATTGRPSAGEQIARDRMRRARAPRWCRGRRSRDPRPGSPRASAAPASAGPARTPRRAALRRGRKRRERGARAARSATWAISGLNARPALRRIEPRDRRAVGGVGAEPVDGLGRERHQAAVRQHARGRPRSHRGSAGMTTCCELRTGMIDFRPVGAATLARMADPSRQAGSGMP